MKFVCSLVTLVSIINCTVGQYDYNIEPGMVGDLGMMKISNTKTGQWIDGYTV